MRTLNNNNSNNRFFEKVININLHKKKVDG